MTFRKVLWWIKICFLNQAAAHHFKTRIYYRTTFPKHWTCTVNSLCRWQSHCSQAGQLGLEGLLPMVGLVHFIPGTHSLGICRRPCKASGLDLAGWTAAIGQSQAPSLYRGTKSMEPTRPSPRRCSVSWPSVQPWLLFYTPKILWILVASQWLFSSDNQSLFLTNSNGAGQTSRQSPQTSCGLYGKGVALKRKTGERREENAAGSPWVVTHLQGGGNGNGERKQEGIHKELETSLCGLIKESKTLFLLQLGPVPAPWLLKHAGGKIYWAWYSQEHFTKSEQCPYHLHSAAEKQEGNLPYVIQLLGPEAAVDIYPKYQYRLSGSHTTMTSSCIRDGCVT